MKTVIITGASSGIGKETARYFNEKGWNVVINSSNANLLKQAYRDLGSPENMEYVAGDVSNKKTGIELAARTLETFGSIDTLINNAGVFAPKPFLEVEETELNRFWAVNLLGTFFTSQAVIPQMLKQGHGNIINIGTVLVEHAIDGFPATAPLTSKGAVHALTRQMAAEFGRSNIRINTIAPGVIRSPLQGKIGIEDADGLGALHLLNRVGEVNEIAEAAYYLSTADFITGETINVAGGHSVGHAI